MSLRTDWNHAELEAVIVVVACRFTESGEVLVEGFNESVLREALTAGATISGVTGRLTDKRTAIRMKLGLLRRHTTVTVDVDVTGSIPAPRTIEVSITGRLDQLPPERGIGLFATASAAGMAVLGRWDPVVDNLVKPCLPLEWRVGDDPEENDPHYLTATLITDLVRPDIDELAVTSIASALVWFQQQKTKPVVTTALYAEVKRLHRAQPLGIDFWDVPTDDGAQALVRAHAVVACGRGDKRTQGLVWQCLRLTAAEVDRQGYTTTTGTGRQREIMAGGNPKTGAYLTRTEYEVRYDDYVQRPWVKLGPGGYNFGWESELVTQRHDWTSTPPRVDGQTVDHRNGRGCLGSLVRLSVGGGFALAAAGFVAQAVAEDPLTGQNPQLADQLVRLPAAVACALISALVFFPSLRRRWSSRKGRLPTVAAAGESGVVQWTATQRAMVSGALIVATGLVVSAPLLVGVARRSKADSALVNIADTFGRVAPVHPPWDTGPILSDGVGMAKLWVVLCWMSALLWPVIAALWWQRSRRVVTVAAVACGTALAANLAYADLVGGDDTLDAAQMAWAGLLAYVAFISRRAVRKARS